MAEFGVETRWTLACTLCNVTIGDTRLRRETKTMLLQAAYKWLGSANKRFCSVLLTSCTPHIATIPSFPPSIFQCHSLVPHISLCFLSSRPSNSTLQTTRARDRCGVLHASCPIIPSFTPSIFWCHSVGAYKLLCLSCYASRFHILVAPQCK